MIDTAYVQRMARYNRWQNANLYGVADTLAPALLIAQRVSGAVQILVLPAIVARHALYISGVDHVPVPTVIPGRRAAASPESIIIVGAIS